MEVLDERLLHGGHVVGVAHDRRDLGEAGAACRPPPPLPHDELEPVVDAAHQDRLEHTDLSDRVGEVGQRRLVEVHPGLVGVGDDLVDRDHRQVTDAGDRAGPVDVRDE